MQKIARSAAAQQRSADSRVDCSNRGNEAVISRALPQPRQHLSLVTSAATIPQGLRHRRFTASPFPRFASAFAAAFSLIEILITVGLLSFIILGLLLMFNQVQRAFRSSMTQTDVLESGRAVTDSLARELAEMTPCQISYTNPNNPTFNFMAQLADDFTNCVLQDLPGTSVSGVGPYHVNLVQRFFFMSKSNQTYIGTGYTVISDFPPAPNRPPVGFGTLGTLYRFSVATNKYSAATLANKFFNDSQSPTNRSMHRIADGIVHLRLQTYDTNGSPMFYTNNYLAFWGTNRDLRTPWVSLTNTIGAPDFGPSTKYWFKSNAVPAYVELEIGFLEPHLLDRYRALAEADTTGNAARSYLATRTANVHIFRQRIPIRSVDYSAYQ